MKVKIKKGFTHNDKAYKEGDEIDLNQEEIRILARQGYCDEPAEPKGADEDADSVPVPAQKADPAHKAGAPEPPKKR